MVIQDKVPILSAAFRLGLNFSSAKYILKSFRDKGKIHRKRQDKDKIVEDDLIKDLQTEARKIKKRKDRSKGYLKK